MLPGLDVKFDIRDGGGRDHSVAPHGSKPLHVGLVGSVNRDALEIVEDVSPPHLPQSPKQIARVIQHHARVAALSYQLRNDL